VPNPYESPKGEERLKKSSTSPPDKSQAWQLVLFAFAVLGYLLGYWLRRSLGLSGAIPGAIFGGVGVGLAVAVGLAIKAVVAPHARV
jgi:hypothetical protein